MLRYDKPNREPFGAFCRFLTIVALIVVVGAILAITFAAKIHIGA